MTANLGEKVVLFVSFVKFVVKSFVSFMKFVVDFFVSFVKFVVKNFSLVTPNVTKKM